MVENCTDCYLLAPAWGSSRANRVMGSGDEWARPASIRQQQNWQLRRQERTLVPSDPGEEGKLALGSRVLRETGFPQLLRDGLQASQRAGTQR